MKIKLYQVDAFARHVFEGNPAAICPLEHWIDDHILQKIAEENNLSETAYFVPEQNGFHLRWFTPVEEVDLCGHATLAAAHVIFNHLNYAENQILFSTRSGTLTVEKNSHGLSMDFPASTLTPIQAPTPLLTGLGTAPKEIFKDFDYIVVLDSEEELVNLKPDFSRWLSLDLRGVVVTAPGNNTDFVSRCFFPKHRINEDPVTGSAHCETAPYWAKKLGKHQLSAKQLSKRGGFVECSLSNDRVTLTGSAIDYMQGEITLEL